MKRNEFINWLKNTCFTCWCESVDDITWKYEVDYANCVWDELYVWENNADFYWEEVYWGGTNYNSKKFTFEEFIKSYENDSYKN